jgi:hypothetical protein
MAKSTDDLEAVRLVVTALTGFSPDEQHRIIRWAREKLGLVTEANVLQDAGSLHIPGPAVAAKSAEPSDPTKSTPAIKDIKSFVDAKNPKNDIQFAATVAYFYGFEAPTEQRKSEIDAEILQDACRLAGRNRFSRPLITLNNAKKQGLLDSGSGPGQFVINTVGENLVAMTLPSGPSESSKPVRRKKKTQKRTARKKK